MAIFIFKADNNRDADIEFSLASAGFGQIQTFHYANALLEALGIRNDGTANPYYAQVDLFILDGISQLKDFEVIGALRRNFRYQDTPIIVMSESREPEFVQMMFAFGANDYINKPFQQVELVARVRACLRLKHEIDRRQARERELTEVSKQLAELNTWLAKLSLMDGLTRVSNRRAFDETLMQEWKRSVRNKSPMTLLMIDVDYFKQYNDSFGHQAGDDCLKAIVDNVKTVLNRPADFLCRYGGDEFAALLPDTNVAGAKIVAERIQKHIEGKQIPQANSAPKPFITVTVGGTSWYPHLSDSMNDFLHCADTALYRAKAAGRNCVEILESAESLQERPKDHEKKNKEPKLKKVA